MKRSPVVADRFYPGDPAALTAELTRLVPDIPLADRQPALAVISPHAGYFYSGAVAGETLARVEVPPDVVILGPNHHGQGADLAVMGDGVWQMPMGDVPVNRELAAAITESSPLFVNDDLAHRFEHSLEVQVPFLQFLRKELAIVPIVVSHLSYGACQEAGKGLADAIRQYGKPTLIVASTDMTHYESRQSAAIKDRRAIDYIEKLDPRGLYQTVLGQGITMCGVIPTTMALIAAIELGAERTELVRYTDSGEASGDTRQVVGYAGIIIVGLATTRSTDVIRLVTC
ncbi:MAG: AmmeMemoRadiSam system protein B [Desulfobacterales bacterium]|nr:AmmeMemoRadiSam system protein B [Desulfobacterales bacterium]